MVGERLTAESNPAVRARHIARYRRAIELAGRTGGTWWDVACGDGYGTGMMPADRAAGFDCDRGALGVARATCKGARFWEVDLSDAYWCDWEPNAPHVILSVETLEHLPQEAQAPFVASLAHVLRPHGTVVVCCPLGNGPNPNNPWHLHEPTEEELREMLAARFPSVEIETERYWSTSGPSVQAYAVCHAE